MELTFEEYGRALELVDCEIRHYTLNAENNFTLNKGILFVIRPNCDMLFYVIPIIQLVK